MYCLKNPVEGEKNISRYCEDVQVLDVNSVAR